MTEPRMSKNDVSGTISFCPCCYSVIPATLYRQSGGVWMRKTCLDHGEFNALVERDEKWFDLCQELSAPNIYDGYFVDVTDRCNLQCKYCYHENGKSERKADEVIKDCLDHVGFAPFFLTGGEPTTHSELDRIVKEVSAKAETWVLTNGIKLCDETYFDLLCASGLLAGNVLFVGLSIHEEAFDSCIKVLEMCRAKHITLGTVMYVIDRLEQIPEALSLYEQYKDVIGNMRIKSASNLWQTGTASEHIFVSDMIGFLNTLGNVELLNTPELRNKVSYANVRVNGMTLMLVAWYDVFNVDLNDINCAPYYKAKDGRLYNFVIASLLNEGIECSGKFLARRATSEDVEEISYLWEDFYVEENPGSNPNREEWKRQTLVLMKKRDYYMLVVQSEEKIVNFQDGIVMLEPGLNKTCIMGRHLYTIPEYRSGDATKLSNKLTLKFGKRAGATDVIRAIPAHLVDYWKSKGSEVLNTVIKTSYIGG